MNAWTFAVDLWSRPAVEDICIDLQETHGQSVVLLIWRLWTIEAHLDVGDATVADAVALARTWDAGVAAPLRHARRALRAPPLAIGVADVAALRISVRAADLAAERLLLEALERITPDRAAGETPRLDALIALTGRWGQPAPAELLMRLVEAI